MSLQHVFIWYHLAYSSLLQALVLQQLFIMAPDAVGDMYVMISTPFFFSGFFQYVGTQNTRTRRHSQMHTPAHAQTHAYCMCTCVCVHDCVLFRCQAILVPTKCCRNIYYVGMCKCKYMVYLTYLMICDATSCAFFFPSSLLCEQPK